MRTNPERRIDALVGELYETAFDEVRWRGLSSRLALALDADSCVLKMVSADGRVDLTDVTDNLVVSPSKAAWAEHWHQNDLWVERSLAAGKARIVTSDELASTAEFERSAFYREWTRHLGIYHMIGAVLDTGDGDTGVVGVHRPRDGRPFGLRDRRTLASLLPHMQRVLRLRSAASGLQFAGQALESVLAHCALSVLVVDGERRVFYCCGATGELLGPASALRVSRGRLTARDPHVDDRLRHVIQVTAAIAEGRSTTAPPAAITLAWPGGPPADLWAYPLHEPARTTGLRRGRVLLLVKDGHRSDSPTSRARGAMAQAFGLTPREADVACAVGSGASVDDIARQLSMSPGHVRQRLKTIYAKTGTARQSQLCALVHRMR